MSELEPQAVDAEESEEDYRDKSPSAGRMGKAVEYLVASACILASRGN